MMFMSGHTIRRVLWRELLLLHKDKLHHAGGDAFPRKDGEWEDKDQWFSLSKTNSSYLFSSSSRTLTNNKAGTVQLILSCLPLVSSLDDPWVVFFCVFFCLFLFFLFLFCFWGFFLLFLFFLFFFLVITKIKTYLFPFPELTLFDGRYGYFNR